MNPKLRPLYLIFGLANLVWLFYYGYTAFPDYNPINILVITIPDMLIFYLAYKTYPEESEPRMIRQRQNILEPEMVKA